MSKITDSHVLTNDSKSGSGSKFPIFLTKPYYSRDKTMNDECVQEGSYNEKRKRTDTNIKTGVKRMKASQNNEEINYKYGIARQDILEKLPEFKVIFKIGFPYFLLINVFYPFNCILQHRIFCSLIMKMGLIFQRIMRIFIYRGGKEDPQILT